MITSEPYQVDWEACREKQQPVKMVAKSTVFKTYKYITQCKPPEEITEEDLWFYMYPEINNFIDRCTTLEIRFWTDRAAEFKMFGHTITFSTCLGGGHGWFIDGEYIRNPYTIKRRMKSADPAKH